jgi:hypothetical protein
MIPEKNNEIYLNPSFNEIILKAKENRKLREKFFEKYNFFKFYNGNIKICSGHQVYIFHPGIWAKIIFLNFFKDFEKIFITNDSDKKTGIFIDIPIFKDKWRKIREYIYFNSDEKTFEEYDFKKFEEGINHFSKNFNEMKQFLRDDIKEKIEIFVEKLKEEKNPVLSLINARKFFEKEKNYKEIRVSEFSKDENFLKFFLYFFYEIERISEIYNESLKEFRILRDIKKEGEPFPFLLKYENFYEVPFWIIKDGRKRIFKENKNLYAENERILKLNFDFEKDFEMVKNLNIRPRAFTLSIYQRIFLSDFFIHGYGGKKYDELGEIIFEKIFNLKMPECALLTGTFYIFDGNPSNISKKILDLKEKEKNLLKNPEKFIDDEIVKEKMKLIEEIENKKNKSEFYEKIREINKKIREKTELILESIRKEIKMLEEKEEEEKVKYFREYPYFYFDYERIKRAIEGKI